MQTNKISIIIATYNSGKTLSRCLDSIVPQLADDTELIVIDGASKDNTCDILNSYRKYISYFISEPDKGVYDAWNKGIKHAKGKWITFIGSDDMLLPDAINKYHLFLDNNGNDYDLISGKLYFVNSEGNILREVGEPWDWKKFVYSKLSFAHPGTLHNKRLFDKIGLFDLRYRICADSDFFQKIGPDAKAGYIDDFLVKMYQGGLSDGLKAVKEGFITRKRNRCIPLWINYLNTVEKVLRYYGGKIRRKLL